MDEEINNSSSKDNKFVEDDKSRKANKNNFYVMIISFLQPKIYFGSQFIFPACLQKLIRYIIIFAKIKGINMDQLEQRIDGILQSINPPKP